MSGISKIALRLVGAVKYATNITTYRRFMTPTTNNFNHSLLQSKNLNHNESKKLCCSQANEKSTNYWSTVRAVGRAIFPILEENKRSILGDLEVSLGSNKAIYSSQNITKQCMFSSVFRTKLNGKLLFPKSNVTSHPERKTLFYNQQWQTFYDVESSRVYILNNNKIFYLTHEVVVEALMNQHKVVENGHVLGRLLDSDIKCLPLEIKSKTKQSILHKRSFPLKDGHFLDTREDIPQSLIEKGNNEITETANNFGEVKLQFPMTVSFENRQIIKLNDRNDTLTVIHRFIIEPRKHSLSKNLEKVDPEESPTGKFEMKMQGGDLLIQPTYLSNRSIRMTQNVHMVIDFDRAVPTIRAVPHLTNSIRP